MTHWAQLLHFYQPPTQTHDILRKVAEESYRPLLKVLQEHSHARVAVNIQGCLTEMLQEHGLGDIVSSLRALAEKGRIEFVGSGKYHPILPLIPESERQRSITENDGVNAAAFGASWKPRGFFPPEMCFSPEVTPSIAAARHQWLIVSGVACPAEWPTNRVYHTPAGSGELAVLFRDDVRSNRISFRKTDPQHFVDDLSKVGGHQDAYVVTAMDAETFGHHIAGWERDFLGGTLSLLESQHRRGANRVRMVLPSDLLTLYPSGPSLIPHASSWSTSTEDLAAGNPFPLWKAPGNEVHNLQWEYVDHCLALVSTACSHAASPEARKFANIAFERLEPALHSCQFWWASRRPMWDVTMVHRGLMLLGEVQLHAGRAIAVSSAPEALKREAAWRNAAANEIRQRVEYQLVHGVTP